MLWLCMDIWLHSYVARLLHHGANVYGHLATWLYGYVAMIYSHMPTWLFRYGLEWLLRVYFYTALVWVNLTVCDYMASNVRSYMNEWLYGYEATA